ncbi:MAG: fumarate hydratase [Dehalococcoidia bacterium]|nr:fumarate hydratase [Dehalococcoidia bacterium]
MREIRAAEISHAVTELIRRASFELPPDMLVALGATLTREHSPLGKSILANLLENARLAHTEHLPLCQDCGVAVFFLELGQDVHIVDGNLSEAVADGTRRGYGEHYLRASMVTSPFTQRWNTGDNTPPVMHVNIVPGEALKIRFVSKGGGAENMSRLFMLQPGAGSTGIMESVVVTVKEAGGKACPPLIIGLGIGSTAEVALTEAKRCLLRPVGRPATDPEVATLEQEVLSAVNQLGIGPLGLGGTTTAIAVHAIALPCHLASLPVAVSLQCHSARHAEVIL